MKKYSYAAEYYQKHGNLYITGSYPPVDGKEKMKTGSLAEWNPILVTSPYPESIMSEDAESNNVCSFILICQTQKIQLY